MRTVSAFLCIVILLLVASAYGGDCANGVCTVQVSAEVRHAKAIDSACAAAGEVGRHVGKLTAVPVKAVGALVRAIKQREHKPAARVAAAVKHRAGKLVGRRHSE
jgi:hypothetical protein